MKTITIKLKNKVQEKETLKKIKEIKGITIEVDSHIEKPSKRFKKRSILDLKGIWKDRIFEDESFNI